MAPRRSLAATIQRIDGPWPSQTASVRGVAAYLGMRLPVSVLDLMSQLDALPTKRDWEVSLALGDDFALGGTTGISIQSDGSWRFHGSLHDSGFDSYAFRVVAIVRAPDDSTVLDFLHAGSVGGTVGGGSRDHSWDEPSLDQARRFFVQRSWPAISAASLHVNLSATDEGVGGDLVSALADLASFVIADVLLGPGVAVTFLAGAIVGSSLDSGGGFGELVGLFVVGGAMFLVANGIFLPVLPLGLAAWAVTDAIVRHRHLTSEEEAFANRVFRGTLPPRDRLVLTNLAAVTGRAFTWPNVDGSMLINLVDNTAYDDPVHYQKSADDRPGRLLIHELTHAWQLDHTTFMPMTICDGITGRGTEIIDGKSAYYNPGQPGLAWDKYSLEQQAVIVAMWYTGQVEYQGPTVHVRMDKRNPWFRYIEENIWLGVR